jgi:hypothetical protein
MPVSAEEQAAAHDAQVNQASKDGLLAARS